MNCLVCDFTGSKHPIAIPLLGNDTATIKLRFRVLAQLYSDNILSYAEIWVP